MEFVSKHGDFFGAGHGRNAFQEVLSEDFLLLLGVLEKERFRSEVKDAALLLGFGAYVYDALFRLIFEVDVRFA